MKRFPLATLLISICALIVWRGGSAVVDALEWDRSRIADGQWWRVATGHLCHWSGSHFFWDMAMFSVLGACCEVRGRAAFILCAFITIVFSQVALSISFEFETYRGLSGIASALLVYLSANALFGEVSKTGQTLGCVGLIGIIAKIVSEKVAGAALFASDFGSGVTVASDIHLSGLLAGLTVAAAAFLRRRVEARLHLVTPNT